MVATVWSSLCRLVTTKLARLSTFLNSPTRSKGTYYLFYKEKFGVKTGERRDIWMATSKRLERPYILIEGPSNKGQIVPVPAHIG